MKWYPWHIDDYARDTRHLTLAEHGAYRLLLDCYMREREPLPDNDRALAAITGVGVEEWLTVATNVRAFFRPKDGTLIHKRCEQELRAQNLHSRKQSEKGKKGAFSRYSKIKGLNGTGIAQAWPHPATLTKTKITTTEQGAEVAEEAFEKKGRNSPLAVTPELLAILRRKSFA